MALFTDGNISTVEDLRSYERAILDMASTERLDLSRKLALAQQEIALDVTDFLLREAGQDGAITGTAQPELDRVVVTEPLRQWHTLRTLALVYRDAYSSYLNDRYRAKQKEFERLDRWASERYFETGAGLVAQPIPRPAPPTLDTDPGSAAGGTYWVCVSWTDRSGGEGAESEPAVLTTGSGMRLTVEAGAPPAAAFGWNIYAGLSAEEMSRQNEASLTIGSRWIMPDSGLRTGTRPGGGQSPEYFVRRRRVLQRG